MEGYKKHEYKVRVTATVNFYSEKEIENFRQLIEKDLHRTASTYRIDKIEVVEEYHSA